MAESTEVSVKPVKSFVIRPMGDNASSALIFQTQAGHSGFRIANADIGRMISLIIGELAKLPVPEQPSEPHPNPIAPMALRGIDVAEGRDETEVVLNVDFGTIVLPLAINRNDLAKVLTSFLKIVKKID